MSDSELPDVAESERQSDTGHVQGRRTPTPRARTAPSQRSGAVPRWLADRAAQRFLPSRNSATALSIRRERVSGALAPLTLSTW